MGVILSHQRELRNFRCIAASQLRGPATFGNVIGAGTSIFGGNEGVCALLSVRDPATNAFAPRRTTIQPKLLAPTINVIGDFLQGNLAGCQASAQLYDQFTGWSTEAVNGR